MVCFFMLELDFYIKLKSRDEISFVLILIIYYKWKGEKDVKVNILAYYLGGFYLTLIIYDMFKVLNFEITTSI